MGIPLRALDLLWIDVLTEVPLLEECFPAKETVTRCSTPKVQLGTLTTQCARIGPGTGTLERRPNGQSTCGSPCAPACQRPSDINDLSSPPVPERNTRSPPSSPGHAGKTLSPVGQERCGSLRSSCAPLAGPIAITPPSTGVAHLGPDKIEENA